MNLDPTPPSRKILLTIEFDGSDFAGWQLQADLRTVQGEIETVLRRMFREPHLRVKSSGRTDSGVHALGMCAVFTFQHPLPLDGLVRGMNAQLPRDITILHAREVPASFCPRHASKGKVYRYRLWNHPLRSSLEHRYSWHISDPLDLGAMQEAARFLLGRHDFSSFRASGCTATHPIREMYDIRIAREGSLVLLDFDGSAFLRHMVRNLTSALISVGRSDKPPSWLAEILAAKDRRLAPQTAPAQGLYLLHVRYNLPPLPLV